MPSRLRLRLSLLLFLHCAVGGAWLPVLSLYLQHNLRFSVENIASIFALMPLASIAAPLVSGQLADRYFALQRFLGATYLLGGVLLYLLARQAGVEAVAACLFGYFLLSAQANALSNALAFHHLPDPARNFGAVRVWGTIGWIAAGWGLTAWRRSQGVEGGTDALLFAAGLSLVLGLYCLTLPHTPPAKSAQPWAFLAAWRLLRDRNFAVFMALAFVISSQLQYFAQISAPFLHRIGIASADLPAVMTVAQVSEIVAMAVLLPALLPRLGVRKCLVIGAAAWPLRCLVYALGRPLGLVIASLALSGISFTFFTIVAQVYVNEAASSDIKASAQSLLVLVGSGLGSFLGAFWAGAVQGYFSMGAGAARAVNYTQVFLVPATVLTLAVLAFFLLFRDQPVARYQAKP